MMLLLVMRKSSFAYGGVLFVWNDFGINICFIGRKLFCHVTFGCGCFIVCEGNQGMGFEVLLTPNYLLSNTVLNAPTTLHLPPGTAYFPFDFDTQNEVKKISEPKILKKTPITNTLHISKARRSPLGYLAQKGKGKTKGKGRSSSQSSGGYGTGYAHSSGTERYFSVPKETRDYI